MEDVRATLQVTMRRFGMLNKNCCSAGGHDISLVQSHILYEIARTNSPSMQQIADTIGMDITTFSRQIQTLVKLKLVAKRKSHEDKRVYHLSLTSEGETVEKDINQQMIAYLGDVFSNVSEEEGEEIVEALKVLNRAMSKSNMCCKPLY
jgi:DNA-binding MarR family transcriptional regulator